MLAFALMKANLTLILLLVGAYLLVLGISVYYYIRYSREM